MHGDLAHLRLEYFADDGEFPNSLLPTAIYRQAVGPMIVTLSLDSP